jgi:hypothetical protein
MKTTRTVRLFPSLLLFATLLAVAGCNWTDWLKSTGSESRSSPVINDLNLDPTRVSCDELVTFSFAYSDPQNDMLQVRLVARSTAEPVWTVERFIPWSDMDVVTSPGRAIGEFSFECGGPPRGVYTVAVEVEDERGHLSNVLEGEITLR